MATYDIAATRAAIKALLEGISSVSVVYDFPQGQIASYPAVVFELDNEDAEMLDDANNTRKMTFKLWVIVEVPNEGISAAKDLLDSVTKDVVNTLEDIDNADLSGNADWTMPVVGQRGQVEGTVGSVLYQELMLKVNVASSIL